jgi:aminoglycoside phosphotransferase (APT) family kinase protein
MNTRGELMHDLAFPPSSASVEGLESVGAGRQAEIFAWPAGGVLKLFRRPEDRASAQKEAAVMYALEATEIPMPRILGTVSIEQRPGIIMERLDGPDQLTLLGRKPWSIWTASTNLARLHARLHATTAPEQLPSLRTTVRQEIARSDLVPSDCKQIAFDALDRLPDGAQVCHWDFHPGNVIETIEGPKVIDWTSARRGDALADVARTLLILRGGALPPEAPFLVRRLTAIGRAVLGWRYLNEYRRLRPFQDRELGLWGLVNAASRLSYGIASEREQLLALVRNV